MFSVCFQSVTKYALTLKENITLSSSQISGKETDFKSATCMSGVDEMCESFTQGYDTELTRNFSPDGREPSLGQWQKIAIARTFFRNADITILDEPSSALDPEAEDFVFSSFSQFNEDRGGIIISHRLSSVLLVDRIFLIEQGMLIECGTHSELMGINGRYAELYNMQANKYKGVKS